MENATVTKLWKDVKYPSSQRPMLSYNPAKPQLRRKKLCKLIVTVLKEIYPKLVVVDCNQTGWKNNKSTLVLCVRRNVTRENARELALFFKNYCPDMNAIDVGYVDEDRAIICLRWRKQLFD